MKLILPEPILSGKKWDTDIATLMEPIGSDRRELLQSERTLLNLVLPPWQRPEVWSQAQKARFIEGIFLGFGAGYYVINGLDWGEDGKEKPMAGWLLDGQQRISSIRDFIEDKLPIFEGIFYSDLDKLTILRRFKRQHFHKVEIQYTGDEQLLKTMYERLSFGGTAHTEADRVILLENSITPVDAGMSLDRPKGG